eukprot:jgi/Botrbrau1/18895/Bobra.177_2s0053.1
MLRELLGISLSTRTSNLLQTSACVKHSPQFLPKLVPEVSGLRRACTCLPACGLLRNSCQKRCQTVNHSARSSIVPAMSADRDIFTIVGGGRIGEALANLGGSDVIVRRGEAIPDQPSGAIIVCTRNDDLEAVVAATPESRRADLVFIQNGMLQPWLAQKGLAENTQVLVYFAVARKGDPPIDGKTDLNPEGLTAAWGPHASAFAARLAKGGLSCKVLAKEDFQKSMLEKLIWISAFMLVGARHKVTVGEVESQYQSEVAVLIEELAKAGEAELGIKLDDQVVERLCAYARSVASFPTAIKEFPWRNGWFYGLSQRALEKGESDPLPLHTSWLKEVGAV